MTCTVIVIRMHLILLFSFHVALLRTHIQMIPSMTDKNFVKPLQTNDKNMHHVLHVRKVKTKKKKNVYIFVVFVFRWIFCFKFFCLFFFLLFLTVQIKRRKTVLNVWYCCICVCMFFFFCFFSLVHDWNKYSLIGGTKVKLIVFCFDDDNEE